MDVKSVPKYLLSLGELKDLMGSRGKGIPRGLQREELTDLGSGRLAVKPAVVRRFLVSRGWTYPFKVIIHVNLKGGVGKTTCAITTATRALQYGFRICVLDLDSQASASLAFDKILDDGEPVFCDVWQKPEQSLQAALKPVEEGLALLPSSLDNSLLDAGLASPKHQKFAVRRVCETLQQLGFDLVIVDCPPSLGTAVISSICAAHTIVIPIGSDPFSLKGLRLTLGEIEAICHTYRLRIPEIKVLFSRYDRREKMAEETIRVLARDYSAYETPRPIRVSTDFSKALARKETIFANFRGSKVKADYDIYVRDLLGLVQLNSRSKT